MSDANELMQEPELHVDEQGDKRWKLNGTFHRVDGPAIELADGAKSWFVHGKYHREDGAAYEKADGAKEWWLNDGRYDDVAAWAKAALKFNNIKPTQQLIDDKIRQVMRADLFN